MAEYSGQFPTVVDTKRTLMTEQLRYYSMDPQLTDVLCICTRSLLGMASTRGTLRMQTLFPTPSVEMPHQEPHVLLHAFQAFHLQQLH